MTFQVAIASHHRAEILANYTYPLLLEKGVRPSQITVFVNTEEDREPYVKLFPLCNVVATGKQGIGETRNFIQLYYPEGTHLVFADDDIKKFVQMITKKQKAPVNNLNYVIEKGFTYCKLHKTALWGVSPTANAYFMRHKVTTDLRFIWASFYGIIVSHDRWLLVTMENGDLDDHERAIKYYLKYGKIIRLNMFGFEADYQGFKGGMSSYRNRDARMRNAQKLVKTYPQLCKIFYKSSSPLPELRLKDRRFKS